jgi:hypothetical protein
VFFLVAREEKPAAVLVLRQAARRWAISLPPPIICHFVNALPFRFFGQGGLAFALCRR